MASMNKPGVDLREFADTDDLFDNVESEQILEWVNAYAKLIGQRKSFQRKYQKRKQLLAKAAKTMLDPDEIARMQQIAEEDEDV